MIHRIAADPTQFAEMDGKPYRPENVLLFLASQPNLDTYLAQIEALQEKDRQLPEDVMQRIAKLRKASRSGPEPGCREG